MKQLIKSLKDIKTDNCVSILLNTHRTRPENDKDALVLKNLVKEVENRLLQRDKSRDIAPILEQLDRVIQKIDHNQNLESMAIFVNADMAELVRLPVSVEERVVIDNNFATRDLLRALHQNTHYYILVLSQAKARLIEAFNDKIVEEKGAPFPIENTQFYIAQAEVRSQSSRLTNIIAEYYNRIDKELCAILHKNPLPVMICSEESGYHEYLKVADKPEVIYEAFVSGNKEHQTAHEIVSEAWKLAGEHQKQMISQRQEDLAKSVNTGNFLSDLNDIYRAIKAGRVRTLFIEEHLFQTGIIEENEIHVVHGSDTQDKVVVDDLYDELIELNMDFGGETVFLPSGLLSDFNGFAASLRY